MKEIPSTHLALLRRKPISSDLSLENDIRAPHQPLPCPRLDAIALGDEVVRQRLILMAHPRIEQLGPMLAGQRIVLDDGGRIDEGGVALGAGERGR